VPQQSPISFQVRTKNVLIIDGSEAMQQLRARVLRSRGVHVHTAKSVTEAELLWVPDFFDLVLLDVRARDPKKRWSSGERFGACIQGSESGS
jgi:CheY-like chemotaxis protein